MRLQSRIDAGVGQFLQQVPVELPVFIDYDAAIFKNRVIFIYPSSYLVDHQGNIGTLTWEHSNGI